jgi:hypothetical protein
MGMTIQQGEGRRPIHLIGPRARHAEPERKQGLLTLTVLALTSAVSLFAAGAAQAQINLESFVPGQAAVCVSGNQLGVTGDSGNDCDQGFNPATRLTIGPSGSQTTFDAANGNATFGAAATFDGAVTFNSSPTFNAGISTTTGTFSSTVTMNGGLAVGGGQTVNMGNNRVQNVAAPQAGTDATNRDYVDAADAFLQSQVNSAVTVNNQQNTRLTNVETVNTQQDTRLTGVETVNTQQNTRLTALESGIAGQAEQISAINQSLKRLSRRDGELADGIAISLALAQPAFQPGQTFAIRGGWGNFDGSNALGVSAAGLLYSFRNGGSVILDVGVGASMRYNMFAGRGGVTLGW